MDCASYQRQSAFVVIVKSIMINLKRMVHKNVHVRGVHSRVHTHVPPRACTPVSQFVFEKCNDDPLRKLITSLALWGALVLQRLRFMLPLAVKSP